jgi:hypothetical protein
MKVKAICAVIVLPLAMVQFEASAQGARVDGVGVALDVVVNSVGGSAANWSTLVSRQILIPANQIGYCAATASADVLNPGGNDNRYRFTLTRNDTSPAVGAACERTLEIDAIDPSSIVVGTTCPFLNVFPGTHTIRFLATKFNSGDANVTVDDSSLTIVCSDKQL